MLESGLEVIAYNVNRKAQDLKLYEFGNIYHQESVGKYEQSTKLAIWIKVATVTSSIGSTEHRKQIFITLKASWKISLTFAALRNSRETAGENTDRMEKRKTTPGTERTGRSCGAPKLFDIKQEVFYAEIDVTALVEAAEGVKVRYTELPKYPSMRRDLALVLDKDVPYSKGSGHSTSPEMGGTERL